MSDKYHDWIEAKTKLSYWKTKELEIRDEILEEMSGEKDEGVVTKTVKTLKIKATFKLGRKINKPILNSIYKKLTDGEKECLKFTPEINLKKYIDLEDEGTSKLLDAIEIKPRQGSIEINEI